MAASAFAAPAGGIYLGGNVAKHYSLADYVNNAQQAIGDVNTALASGLSSILYVNEAGELSANANDILEAGSLNAALHEVTADDFVLDEYTNVGTGEKLQPKKEFPAGELKVESVSAINSTSVKVSFNHAVEALTKDQVTVVNKATSEKQYVKTVALSEDKKSATVEFYESLANATYTLSVKVGEATASKDFDFAKGEPAQIVADTQQIVEVGVASPISFKVLDNNGLDITKDVKVEFESTVTPDSDNKITLETDGAVAFVVVKVTKEDGTVIKSNRITVKAEAPKAIQFLDWTVGSTNYGDDNYKPVHLVKVGESTTIKAYFKDQFGKDKLASELGNVSYESLDKNIALVDRVTGKVTALKSGTVPVKISISKRGETSPYITKTVELTAGDVAVFNSIALDNDNITISSSLGSTKEVKLTFKDQFGDAIKLVSKNVKAKVKSGSNLIELDGWTQDSTDKNLYIKTTATAPGESEVVLKVKPVAGQAGTSVVELSVDGSDAIAILTVNVEKAGDIADFKVEGFQKTIDVAGANDNDKKLPKSMNIEVFSVDANGAKAGKVSNVKYTIKDDKNNTVKSAKSAEGTVTVSADDPNLEDGKSYTLSISVGSLEVFSDKFAIVNTTELPTVTLTKNKLDAKDLDIFKSLDGIMDISYGSVAKDKLHVAGITFNSDNENVITSSPNTFVDEIFAKGEGEATLVINGIKVDVDGDLTTTGDQIEVKFSDSLNVNVNAANLDATDVADGRVAAHTVPDIDNNNVTGEYANGVFTITHPYEKLTEEKGGAPEKGKWVGVAIDPVSDNDKVGSLVVNGKIYYAPELENGKLLYFFKANAAGNTNNLSIIWIKDDGSSEAQKLVVKYVNDTP